jgi:hypothetical protein
MLHAMPAPSSQRVPCDGALVSALWDLADETLRGAGPDPWLYPTVLAYRAGFDLAVGEEAPTAACVIYAWDEDRRERGWHAYRALAMSLLLRAGIPHGGNGAVLMLAQLLATTTRCASVAFDRQQHCPRRVLLEAVAIST